MLFRLDNLLISLPQLPGDGIVGVHYHTQSELTLLKKKIRSSIHLHKSKIWLLNMIKISIAYKVLDFLINLQCAI